MTDIVKELRARDCSPYCDRMSERAAAEIERLRQERDWYKNLHEEHCALDCTAAPPVHMFTCAPYEPESVDDTRNDAR